MVPAWVTGCGLTPQTHEGVLHIAGATHVRLDPSFEVWIQVFSHLKVKDQRFGSFATVVFFFPLAVVTELCKDRVLWRD